MSLSPTERSLQLLRKEGWTVAVVEKWNAHIKRRQDLFGFADLLAFKEGETPLLVQTTVGSEVPKRIAKIRASEHALPALRSGFAIHVHGWRKLASAGGKFVPRIQILTPKDLAPCPSEHSCSPSSEEG